MSSLVGLFRFKTVGDAPAPWTWAWTAPEAADEEAFERPVGGFWSRSRKGEDGDEQEEGEEEDGGGEGLRWARERETDVSGEGERMLALLQKREDAMTLDGEKTGELETATEQDMVVRGCFARSLLICVCQTAVVVVRCNVRFFWRRGG